MRKVYLTVVVRHPKDKRIYASSVGEHLVKAALILNGWRVDESRCSWVPHFHGWSACTMPREIQGKELAKELVKSMIEDVLKTLLHFFGDAYIDIGAHENQVVDVGSLIVESTTDKEPTSA